VHHLHTDGPGRRHLLLPLLLIVSLLAAPDLAVAQASPFMTGATSLQTNARVAREYLVALPVELSPQERTDLVRGFSQELSDRYGFAVDFSIHAPRDFPGSDPRNFHAHLLTTTREVTTSGLGMKTTLDMNDGNRRTLGLGPAINELLHVRERWATVTNEAMQEAHVAARIDHRSLEAQGIDREPQPHIPKAAFEMERHGYRSVVADRIREEYQARVHARLERGAGRVKSADAEPPPLPDDKEASAKSQSLADIRREARESWLRLRESQKQSQGRNQDREHAESAPVAAQDRGHDEHFAR
jgi:ATP-dependent exoDNAse (exonuclease V) alpha subunit